MYTVYIHKNILNGKMYVGITSLDPKIRWKKGFGYSDALPIGRAIRKYGWDNFEHEIVADNLSEEDAKNMEIELIAKYKTQDDRYGYNICSGGEGVRGWKPSEETKKKISDASQGRFGEKNPNYGHKWTREMKEMASERNVSDETRKKISDAAKTRVGNKNSFFGKHHSEETKKKLSKLRSRKVNMYDKDMNLIETFESILSASRLKDINKVSISNCCRGMTRTAGGFVWKYAD